MLTLPNRVAILVVAVCSTLQQGQTRPIATELEGAWVAQEMVARGQAAPNTVVANMKFTFKGDKVTIRGNRGDNSEDTCAFTLDPSASPRRIDIVNPNGVTMEGIYEVNGRVLRIALGRPRPANFQSASGPTVTVITFKKEE